MSGTVGGGERRYTTGGGCGGTLVDHHAQELNASFEARHGFDSGLTMATSAAIAHQEDDAPGAEGDDAALGQVTIRGGYRGAYAGFELGPTLLMSASAGAEVLPLPAGNVWLGVPDVAYVYGDFLTGPMSMVSFPLGVGLGHQSDRVRFEAGVQPGNISRREQCPALHVDGRYRVGRTWLGLNGDGCSAEVWRAGVSVGYSFAALGG